ncbi:zinc-dependent alcohol dehydrogenase family protein [Promicromonospora sp. NPDC090134]|uniref:zinc-dependent alcohol dehydrogenase family protein n=1 Tax=Promicromonospora sp. NPDC090134 TaxID=3364408 RepID=UPI0037F3FD65
MSQLVLTGVGALAAYTSLERGSDAAPGAGEVAVTVEAAPVNPADSLFAAGWYGVQPTPPMTLGSEGVGRVTEIGDGVDSGLLGARVIFLADYKQGTWSHRVIAAASSVVAVPEEADALQLAMLSINPATAHLLLTRYGADLKPGAWVGQTIGNSSVGRYVIALAKRAGYRTLSIVRREEAAVQVRDLGGDAVVLEGEGLAARVAEALDGDQLDIVLDGQGGSVVAELATALRPGGTVVAYSSVTGEPQIIGLGDLIYKEITLTGFWLVNWVRSAPRAEIEALYTELAGLVADGTLSVPIGATFPLKQFQAAFEAAFGPERTGKVLFTPGESS